MKVLYISQSLKSVVALDLVRALADYADVVPVVPLEHNEAAETRAGSIAQQPVPIRSAFNLFDTGGWLKGFKSLVGELSPDLIHIDASPAGVPACQAVAVGRRVNRPVIVAVPGEIRAPRLAARRFLHYVTGRAAGIICRSETCRAAITAGGYAGPVELVPPVAVNEDRFRPDLSRRQQTRSTLGLSRDVTVIGYAGRLTTGAATDVLLRAVCRVPGAYLVVMGDGPELLRLKTLAESLGIQRRVYFAGARLSAERAAWFPGLDLFVAPATGTGDDTLAEQEAVVQAMSSGVPVVTSDTGALAATIGGAGIALPRGNVEALSEALERLGRSPQDRLRFSQLGRQRVLENFTCSRVARRVAAYYREVIAAQDAS